METGGGRVGRVGAVDEQSIGNRPPSAVERGVDLTSSRGQSDGEPCEWLSIFNDYRTFENKKCFGY